MRYVQSYSFVLSWCKEAWETLPLIDDTKWQVTGPLQLINADYLL